MSPVLRRSAGHQTSVPSTTAQAAASRRVAFGTPRVGRLRCQCGAEVRLGFVRCQPCDNRMLAALYARGKGWLPQRAQRALRETKPCECGQPRAPEAPCCPRCAWLDGVKVDAPYVELIRDCGQLTATHLAEMTGRGVDVVREDLRRLERVGRLRSTEVVQGQTQVWYQLVE